MKFLVPLSWLVAFGRQVDWHTAPATVRPVASFVVEQVLAAHAVDLTIAPRPG